jgi:type I restriction enzyme, S subunit
MVTEDWKSELLGNVATLQRGFDLPHRFRKPGPIPIVTSSGIEDTHRELKVRGPGVVTGRYGTIGEVFFVPGDFWPLNTTLYVRDFHGHDPRFISYLLRTIDFHTHSGKTGVPGVNRNDLHEIPVSLPPTKAEEEAIAEALSDADALIWCIEQLLVKKRRLKKGAMQELLTGKKRLPGFSGDWEITPLGALATLYQPITISASQFTKDGFPVYGANGIVGFYDRSNHDTWQVTVTCRGSTCGTVNRTVDRCWITGNAMVLNCDQNTSLCKEFFYYSVSNQDLSGCITGTGQPQIVRSPLAAFSVPLPPTRAEQEAIAAILTDMDAEIAELEKTLVKIRSLKQGMMQELLTGRIRLI